MCEVCLIYQICCLRNTIADDFNIAFLTEASDSVVGHVLKC